MTKEQADSLNVWLFDGFRLLRAWIESTVDNGNTPQPRLELRLDPPDPDPIPAAKRKRGRPRKIQIAAAAALATQTGNGKGQDGETFHCSYCGRILPTGVETLHTANCKAAYRGYASHEASPEKS